MERECVAFVDAKRPLQFGVGLVDLPDDEHLLFEAVGCLDVAQVDHVDAYTFGEAGLWEGVLHLPLVFCDWHDVLGFEFLKF